MNLKLISVRGTTVDVPSNGDVDTAEQLLGIKLPSGYREFITRFGRGCLGNHLFVFLPSKISDSRSLTSWQQNISDNWFWGGGIGILNSVTASSCVPIASSSANDQYVIHPSNPEKIFVLPRESEQAYEAGQGLYAAIDWTFSSETFAALNMDYQSEWTDFRPEKL